MHLYFQNFYKIILSNTKGENLDYEFKASKGSLEGDILLIECIISEINLPFTIELCRSKFKLRKTDKIIKKYLEDNNLSKIKLRMKDEPIQKFLTPSIKNDSQESSHETIEKKPFDSKSCLFVDIDNIEADLGYNSKEKSVDNIEYIIYGDRESEVSVHLELDESDSDSEDFESEEIHGDSTNSRNCIFRMG